MEPVRARRNKGRWEGGGAGGREVCCGHTHRWLVATEGGGGRGGYSSTCTFAVESRNALVARASRSRDMRQYRSGMRSHFHRPRTWMVAMGTPSLAIVRAEPMRRPWELT